MDAPFHSLAVQLSEVLAVGRRGDVESDGWLEVGEFRLVGRE